MNLLSTQSLVESPFIIVKIGKYTFGAYNRIENTNKFGTSISINYPNYMTSLNVTKVNGTVNSYTIVMDYGIRYGDDPNLLEKVFSSVADTRQILISYGDWSTPSFIFKEESAIISNITSNVNFTGSVIRYTITCISNALSLLSTKYTFPSIKAKPSDRIKFLLQSPRYGLSKIFYGMRDIDKVTAKNLIASDDKVVQIPAKKDIPILDYINYLTNCMSSITNVGDNVIKNSRYYLTIYDDIYNEFDGPYFKITKVNAKAPPKDSYDVYELDIGYPGNNYVTGFAIQNNETWSILYKYSEEIDQPKYQYVIDNEGKISEKYTPSLAKSPVLNEITEATKSWWTNMTQFPITATVTIKGLLRPSMLMTYLRLNVYFYGQKHISSGLYIITGEQDTVDHRGYTTTLSLTRIGEDK